MATFDPVAALALPEKALVDRRVPKSLLIENGASTAADRRRIREGIEELRWAAALKPTTIGVSEYRDETREYLEIAVLNLILRSGADAGRLAELVHRAVPYPVLLVATNGNTPEISLAHKRWSQGEAGKTVIDGEIVASDDLVGCSDESTAAFRSSLALDRQGRATLHDLYQGWIDKVEALNVARVTGEFSIPTSSTAAAERSAALRDYWQLETRIAELHAAAEKERQIARKVEINLKLARLRDNRDSARARL
ncbi:MAG: DUF4391 domain-containing protein [Gemmatimonadetes bacterium]|nr:DUF4391 domain-containing protein [Gemmatimonadota bacterium]